MLLSISQTKNSRHLGLQYLHFQLKRSRKTTVLDVSEVRMNNNECISRQWRHLSFAFCVTDMERVKEETHHDIMKCSIL